MVPEGAKANGYNGNGWFWKPVALFMAGSIVAMIGFVTKDIIHSRDFITRAEAQEMVERDAPWLNDRKYVLETLKKIEQDVEFMKRNFWKQNKTN